MATLPVVRFVRKKQEKEKNDMIFNKDKDEHELLVGVTKINPEEFIALAKILDVKMSTVDQETGAYSLRDAEEVLNDIVFAFRKLKHKERKMILKAVKNSGSRA
jgi:ribosome biogenesis protein Nip4